MFRHALCLAFLALLTLPLVSNAQDFENTKIGLIDLGNGLHMMTGEGGNMVVSAGDDVTFLVDDQYAPLTEKIQAAIATVADEPVKYLINTHWHGDHAGGNENFGEAGAVIMAHENVRQRMSTEQVNEVFGRTTPPSPDGALPVITFSEDATLYFNDMAIRAHHVPAAHTDGDSVIVFEGANVIHTGDTFFNGIYPFIDVGSGGSIEGFIAAQTRILELADDETKIVPGHGPLATKADLLRTRDALQQIHDIVKPLVEQGLSAEEIIAAEPLKDIDTGMEGGFLGPDQFLTILSGAFAEKAE